MASEVVATWSSFPIEHRRQVVAIRDVSLLNSLQTCLRTLMTAEMDAAVRGDPVEDKSGMELLSSMEFDMSAGVFDMGAGCAIVWPAKMHAEPARLIEAASAALGDGRAFEDRSAAEEAAEPSPASWQELETCLARHVRRAILGAVDPSGAAPASAGENPGDSDAEEAGAAGGAVLTARAAKRLRQRERRKMGRKARTDAATDAHGDEDPRGASEQLVADSQAPGTAPVSRERWSECEDVATGIAAQEAGPPTHVATENTSAVDNFEPKFTISAALQQATKKGAGAHDSPSTHSRPDEDVASLCSSSSDSCGEGRQRSRTGNDDTTVLGYFELDQSMPEDPCRKMMAEKVMSQRFPPAASLMDSVRARIEEALAGLEAGNTEACREQLKGALSMCTGVDPLLGGARGPISEGRKRLKSASEAEDWTHRYATKEMDRLFHSSMSADAGTVQTLQFLARSVRASRSLQIGALDGQATLGLAEALPSHGRIVVAESDSGFARFAQRELPTLPHSEKISLVYGDIDQTLQALSAQNDGERFHMILVDGHRSDYGAIIDRIMERGFLAPGGLLAVTHSVGAGGFSNSEERAIPWPGQMSDQESLEAAAALHERLARDPQLESVALPIQRGLTLVRRRIVGEDVPQELLAQRATAFPAMPPQPRAYGVDPPHTPMLWPATPENSPMLRPASAVLVPCAMVHGAAAQEQQTLIPWW